MTNYTNKEEFYLTRSQFNNRKQSGQLVAGQKYVIIDDPILPSIEADDENKVIKIKDGVLVYEEESAITLLPKTEVEILTTYSGAINSNATYKFSNPTTSITISGLTATSGDNDPIWSIIFKAGADMALSVPNTVKWENDNEPTFEEGNTYNIMFKQGIGSEYIGKWGEF